MVDLKKINEELKDKDPVEIIRWSLSLNKKAIVTTNFGPHEAAILHMATQVDPKIPVVWIDSGYNTPATYRFADKVIKDLNLNMNIFVPAFSKGYRDVLMSGIPDIANPLHEEFTRQVKLEPFQRAMQEMKPEVWITAIRKDQTAFRQTLDIVTTDDDGVLKVAPVFYWNEKQLEDYLAQNNLPLEKDYHDPTKVLEHRECGLHLSKKKK